MKVADLNRYKRCKRLSKDLKKVIELLDKQLLEMVKWNLYTPIKDVTLAIKDAKTVLKIHYDNSVNYLEDIKK